MLFKSQIVTQASGSVGGITASRNRGGMYFRGRAIPVNPNTARQISARSALSTLVERWQSTLSASQRAAWSLYAANVPLVGPTGDPRDVGGIGMYVRSNVPRLVAGLSRIDAAPTEFSEAPAPIVTAFTSVSGGGVGNGLNVTVSNFPVSGGNVLVQSGRPTAQGVLFFAGPFSFAGSGSSSPVNVPNSALKFATVLGSRQYARVRFTLDDGRLSPPVIVSSITT